MYVSTAGYSSWDFFFSLHTDKPKWRRKICYECFAYSSFEIFELAERLKPLRGHKTVDRKRNWFGKQTTKTRVECLLHWQCWKRTQSIRFIICITHRWRRHACDFPLESMLFGSLRLHGGQPPNVSHLWHSSCVSCHLSISKRKINPGRLKSQTEALDSFESTQKYDVL